MTNEELIKQYTELIEDEDLCIDSRNVLEIIPSLVKLQNSKGHQYGRSYCKFGEMSIFFNLSRKYDRVENIMKRAMENGVESTLHGDSSDSSTAAETWNDTINDMAVYSLMWAGWLRENYPEEWQKFIDLNDIDNL